VNTVPAVVVTVATVCHAAAIAISGLPFLYNEKVNSEKQAPDNPEPLKKCSDCKEEKPLGEYYLRRGPRTSYWYPNSHCKACTALRKRLWEQNNRETAPLRFRKSQLKRYNLTLADYDDLLAAQGGVCAICKTSKPGGKGQFRVDHDHACCPERMRSCGKCIRGLLCNYCNLHLAGKDPQRLRAALKYLENFRRSQDVAAGRTPVSWRSKKRSPVAGSPRAPWAYVPERLF
jgi:hypothetical protein